MSPGPTIVDRARSLLAKVSVDDNGLTGIDEGSLERELKARQALRKKRPPKPADQNPRSRYAGAEPKSALARSKMAERRRLKIHQIRDKRAAEKQRAADEAFRRVKEQARQRPPSSSSARSSSSSGRSTSSFSGIGRDPKVVDAYKTLNLAYGAELSEVKSAYRGLMRKYHPDLHNQSPRKQKAATELSLKVGQAFQILEAHLKS
jgi:DnaJ-domain-containing protein 1